MPPDCAKSTAASCGATSWTRLACCEPHQVVALISDGVAHLMMSLTPDRGTQAGVGGAALEQRIIHRAPARLGDQITIRSGVMEAGEKTMRFCHWVLNRQTGEAVATCEVVAVAFDLAARKALALPAETRNQIGKMAVRSDFRKAFFSEEKNQKTFPLINQVTRLQRRKPIFV